MTEHSCCRKSQKAILKAATVEDLAVGLSVCGCEDSVAAVMPLGSLGRGVLDELAETQWLPLAGLGAGRAGTNH